VALRYESYFVNVVLLTSLVVVVFIIFAVIWF
jgi:hypothetical protein